MSFETKHLAPPRLAARAETPIIYRPGEPHDADAAADLMLQASGNTWEFVLSHIAPDVSARDFLAYTFALANSPYSHRHCTVAQCGEAVVGLANAFPADSLRTEDAEDMLTDAEIHVRGMMELQDWGSYFLNSIAVSHSHRRLGIGSRLIDLVAAEARAKNFDRLSLHVWADNAHALAFYKKRAFQEIGTAQIAWHPLLPHEGGSILMGARLPIELAPGSPLGSCSTPSCGPQP